MRILQLIAETRLGGAESFGFQLSAELARRGHEVLLLATYANGPLFERQRPPGMEVAALQRRGRFDPRVVPFLIGSIRRFRPDLLHGHNFAANCWVRLLGSLFPRIPVVCHEHSGKKVRQPRGRALIDRLLYPRCAASFTVSRELHALLARRYGLGGSVLHYLPNGIDVSHYAAPRPRPAPGGTERGALEVVCVASLTRVKNHAGLLDAWKEVRAAHPQARLTLVGDGGLREALRRQAERNGIAESVRFAGTQTDVRPFLWRASVFVLPSHREGMPLSLLEAMAAGLACVASAVGEIPEIVEEGATGRLVPPGEPCALAAALRSLLDRPEEREAMGRRAVEVVAERYGLSACVESIERVYEKLAGVRGS